MDRYGIFYTKFNVYTFKFVEFFLIALVAMLGQLDQLLGIFCYRLAHPQIFSGLTGNVTMRLVCMCSELTWIATYHVVMHTVSWMIYFSCLCVLPFHKPGNRSNFVEKQYPLKVLASP